MEVLSYGEFLAQYATTDFKKQYWKKKMAYDESNNKAKMKALYEDMEPGQVAGNNADQLPAYVVIHPDGTPVAETPC